MTGAAGHRARRCGPETRGRWGGSSGRASGLAMAEWAGHGRRRGDGTPSSSEPTDERCAVRRHRNGDDGVAVAVASAAGATRRLAAGAAPGATARSGRPRAPAALACRRPARPARRRGSTTQTSARQVGVGEERAASAEPASRCASSRRRELGEPGRPVVAVATDRGQPDGATRCHRRARPRGARRVVEVGAAAGHPGPEVRADRPEDHEDAAGHVLAAVRADALDDRLGAGVADREAHPGPADEVQPPAGRAVEARCCRRWPRRRASAARSGSGTIDDRAARQPLADVVVGLADEPELDARAGERPERLAGRAAELQAGPGRAARRARARRSAPPRTSGRPS